MKRTHATSGRRSRLAMTTALSVLAVACSSTVASGDRTDGGNAAGLTVDGATGGPSASPGATTPPGQIDPTTGEVVTTPGAADDAGATGTGSGGPSGTGSASGSSGTTGPTGTGTTGSGGTGSKPGVFGPGVSDKEVVLGVAIPDEATTGANESFLGVSGVTQGNAEAYADIMAEAINKAGGIAGRKLRFSKWRYSAAQGENLSQLEQSACTYWTQDDPAFLAPAITSSDNFLGCAKDAGMAVRGGDPLSTSDDRTFTTYPAFIHLSAMSLTRQGRILGDGLEAMGYFDADAKVGVVSFDAPQWKRTVEEQLKPALKRHGRAISEEGYVRELQSTSGVGDMTAQLQSIVLRFKTRNITHVILVDSDATMSLLFMRSADNQAFTPRYGMTSQSGGTVLAGLVPASQLRNSLAVGWLPTIDVLESERPANAGADACLARFKEFGEEPADGNNRAIMLNVCEAVDFAKQAIEAGLPDITAQSWTRGSESLGSVVSLNSFGNFIGPGRHDGASSYRHMGFDPACTCFHYTSKPISDTR